MIETKDEKELPDDLDHDQLKIQAVKGMILRAKSKFPYASNQQIADALEVPTGLVRTTLKSTAAKAMIAQQEVDQGQYIASIRNRALSKFSDFLERDDLRPETLLSALKFALANVMDRKEGKSPDSLIFETIISATGQIEQRRLETHGNKVKNVTED